MRPLEFGFGEADARNAKLTALHIWAHPQAGGLALTSRVTPCL